MLLKREKIDLLDVRAFDKAGYHFVSENEINNPIIKALKEVSSKRFIIVPEELKLVRINGKLEELENTIPTWYVGREIVTFAVYNKYDDFDIAVSDFITSNCVNIDIKLLTKLLDFEELLYKYKSLKRRVSL